MADTKILPRQLPANATPPAGAVTIVDDGTSVNKTTLAQLGDAIGAVRSIVEGTNVSVDATDPLNPIINAVGSGDMLASVYDPGGVQSNAFNMQNMEDGTTKVAMTSTERSKLAGIAAGAQVNTVNTVNGYTGAVVLTKADVVLGDVDNTSDANKPISISTQTALDDKADKSITIGAGVGLAGGGTLEVNRSIALNSASIASIALANTAVQPAITISAGTGLTGGGTLAANRSIALNSTSIASLLLADSSVQPTREIIAGTGLTGGGTLAANRTVSLSSASIASLAKADSAIQASALGSLAYKSSVDIADINATGTPSTTSVLFGNGEWRVLSGGGDMLASVYDPQNIAADAFARSNHTGTQPASTITGLTKSSVGLSNVDNTSDLGKPISTATQTALNGKASTDVATASSNGLMSSAQFTKLAGIAAGAQVNTVTSVSGKTGEVTLVKGDVGLGNVDNTSDLEKPVSTATQTVLDGKASTALATSSANGLMPSADKARLDANNVGLGVGQTWTTVTGSRSYEISYQNTTGRTIAVSIDTGNNNIDMTSYSFQLSYDGSSWISISVGTTTANVNNGLPGNYIVPSGLFYKVTRGGASTAAIAGWMELI